jgi:hypothetical protein
MGAELTRGEISARMNPAASCDETLGRVGPTNARMPPSRWIHLTARVTPGAPDLTRADTGAWLWTRMRAAFPQAIAVTLMPDHPHLLLACEDPEAARARLARLLGQFGRSFGIRGQVSLVPAAEPIRDGSVLARQVRYVALNPCRKQLATCPLAWQWSTHRDIVGAIVDPWVSAARLAGALGASSRGFAIRHHGYVSADPHAHVEGTPFPSPAPSTNMCSHTLRSIAEAVAATTRRPVAALRRRGVMRATFVALAIDQGWKQTAQLAEICGCCQLTIRNLAADVNPSTLAAAKLCLGDARLGRMPTRAVARASASSARG